jgi:hypothetical protein
MMTLTRNAVLSIRKETPRGPREEALTEVDKELREVLCPFVKELREKLGWEITLSLGGAVFV